MEESANRCALCLEDGELQESHYIPRIYYKRMQKTRKGEKNVLPVLMTAKTTTYYTDQLTARLLCKRCEAAFNDGGEKWAARCSLRDLGRFELRHLLLGLKPEHAAPECAIYLAGKQPKLRIAELIYFASSVFWRGASHSWTESHSMPRLSLPDWAVEALRTYLLGRTAFPDYISVVLDVQRQPILLFAFPRMEEGTDTHSISVFTIPGLTFYLFIPRDAKLILDPIPSMTRDGQPVLLGDLAGSALRDMARHYVHDSLPVGRLVKDLQAKMAEWLKKFPYSAPNDEPAR